MRYEGGDLPAAENVVPDRALGIFFFFDVHDGKPDIVKACGQFPFYRLFDVICDAMKFLGSDDQIQVRYFVQKGRSAALRHATQKTVYDRAIAGECAQHPHFSQGLLLGQVADAARIQQDNVRLVLFERNGVAALDEHLSHLFGIALVHLASVSLEVNPGHGLGESELKKGTILTTLSRERVCFLLPFPFHQPGNKNADFVEQVHRATHHRHRNRIGSGRQKCRGDKDQEKGVRPGAAEKRHGQNSEPNEHQDDDRQFERRAKPDAKLGNERKIVAHRPSGSPVQRLSVSEKESKSGRQNEVVPENDPTEEKTEPDRDRRKHGLLFRRGERRENELTGKVNQERERDDDSSVEGQLERDRHRICDT